MNSFYKGRWYVLKQDIILPIIVTYVRELNLTFLSDTMHNDSRSRHFESLKHFSNCLVMKVPASDWRPASKWGAAIGLSSTFMCSMPSLGRADFGCCMSHDTFATTLQFIEQWSAKVRVVQIPLCMSKNEYLVWPKVARQQPQLEPKYSFTGRDSSNPLPSKRYKYEINNRIHILIFIEMTLILTIGENIRTVF